MLKKRVRLRIDSRRALCYIESVVCITKGKLYMEYKMIALDLDGTLNNDDKVITPDELKTILLTLVK